MPPALEYRGRSLELSEVIRVAARLERLEFLELAARALVIREEAERAGVAVDDDDLQRAADRFRAARGLHRAVDARAWLDARGLTDEDFEARLRDEIIEDRLRALRSDDEVRAWFERNRPALDAVFASRIVHPEERLLREIDLLVREGASFEALARRYSHDAATAEAGGRAGRIGVQALPTSLWGEARRAAPGTLLPIVPHEGAWALYRVDRAIPAVLDEVMTANARARLLDEWLAPRIAAVSRRVLEIG